MKTAFELILLLTLSTTAVFAQLSPVFAWQMVGSCCGLLALAILLARLIPSYPWLKGRVLFRGRMVDLEAHARRLIPVLLVLTVAVGVLGRLLVGEMPLSHDHPVHLYKAWHFWDEMLLAGRLRGWSSFWFFGYPAEELYPIGPDLWVALFRIGTFGLLSWEATYGLAFVGVFAFAAYSIYSFAKRNFGAAAGVFAALAWTLDMGEYREGGWSYTVEWAVWVQIMAMGFALLAMGRLQAALDQRRPRDLVICGLLVAAALLSHPMNVTVLALGIPFLILGRALAESKPLGREISLTAGAVALGVALAGFWFLPMMARSAWTTDIGDKWRPLELTVRGLLDGTVFANVWPPIVILGLIGAAIGAAMRRSAAVFLLCLAAVFLFASSTTAFDELSLMAISKSFAKIQYQRFTIPAKACLYILGGLALAELGARVAWWRRQQREAESAAESAASASPRLRWLRRAGLTLLLAAVVAPFVRPAIQQLQQSHLRTIGGLMLKRQIPYWDDYQQFLRWSAQKKATTDSFYRISYELDRHNHLMMGAPVYNQTPYYKVGYTPARLFKHVVETTEDPLYQALSVAYVVSLEPLARPGLELEVRFGSLHVYRFKGYRPERYTLTGAGRVEVQEFGEERIRLRLSGTGAGSRLKVHVANYARWRARMNGKTVPISEAPAYGSTYPMLMEVPVVDGELVFDYILRPVDWLGTLATLLGLGVVVLLLMAQHREALAARLTQRLGPIGRFTARWAGWATLGAAVLLVAVVALRLTRGAGGGMDESSLAQLLGKAGVTQAGRSCAQRRGQSWFCSQRGWNYVGPTADKFNGAYIPCIWAHPIDEGPTVIRFPRVKLGQALVGHHGIADGGVEGFPGGASVTMEVQIDGKTAERLVRPNEKGWAGFRVETRAYAGREAELSLIISTSQAGGRHYCFDARLEP